MNSEKRKVTLADLMALHCRLFVECLQAIEEFGEDSIEVSICLNKFSRVNSKLEEAINKLREKSNKED